MDQLAQIIGAILVLLGYVLSQTGRIDAKSRQYLLMNLAGSLLLVVTALLGRQWGFLILNGVWAVVSAINLVRLLARSVESPRVHP